MVNRSRGNSFEIRSGRVPDVAIEVTYTKESSELRYMASNTEQSKTLGDYATDNGAVAHSRSVSRDNPLSVLDEEDPIFADEDLLRIDHIPDYDKIVGRNDQIETVARRLKPTITGGSGKGILLLGKSGSGKTLVTRTSVARSKSEA